MDERSSEAARDSDALPPRLKDTLTAGEGLLGEARDDVAVVEDVSGVRALRSCLFADDRAHPVIAIAPSSTTGAPVLSCAEIRAIVGAEAPVYVVVNEFLVRHLEGELGARLALQMDSVRIWWPGLVAGGDPEDHPLVIELLDDIRELYLAQFARSFELSRPSVRRELQLSDRLKALAEEELRLARGLIERLEQALREAHVERHREATRAALAESAAEHRQPSA